MPCGQSSTISSTNSAVSRLPTVIEFPPDLIPLGEDKAARERRVFQTFAACLFRDFGLAVVRGTIASRDPPEPDILCDVSGHGLMAFELGEIVDEDAMKTTSTMMSARAALRAFRSNLSLEDQIALQVRFATREVKVAFRRDVPLRELQAAVPAFYRWLLRDVADDFHGDAASLPSKLQEAIEYVSILLGPSFIDVAFEVSVTDATLLVAVRKLIHARYETTVPVELLLYAHDQPLVSREAKQSSVFAEMAPLVDESNAKRQIRRVWIFSVAERYTAEAIKFVYPPWAN
jgi:hypothetical protein